MKGGRILTPCSRSEPGCPTGMLGRAGEPVPARLPELSPGA